MSKIMIIGPGAFLKPLGLVATGRRSIRIGSEYDKYFDRSKLTGTDPIIADGDNYVTLEQMEKIAEKFGSQTKAIAAKLKASTLEKSLRDLWSFLYNHVQYNPDSKYKEQLRQPARLWADRKTGVDCDCYAIFISSVLRHWGYPHAFRMADYGEGFQHVYVVVPKDLKRSSLESRSGYYVVDPVVDRFDHEVPFTKKHDRFMQIQMLNGVDAGKCSNMPPPFKYYERAQQFKDRGLVITRELLAQKNIPIREVTTDAGFGYSVSTAAGELFVPAVITPEDAGKVVTAVSAPATADKPNTVTASGPLSAGWGWLLAAAGVLVVIGAKKKSTGLSGAPPKKKAKRELETIHI